MLIGTDQRRVEPDEPQDLSFVLRQHSFENSTWLPAALLATLVLLASTLQAFGGERPPLEWRPAFVPAKKLAQPPRRTVRQVAPGWQEVRDAAVVQHAVVQHAVVQVAYEDEGVWSTTSSSTPGSARMDTLVVHPRDPQFEGTGPAYRVAQDPFANDNLDAELSRDINLPFGENRMPEELPELSADQLPTPVEPEFEDDLVDDLTDDAQQDDLPFDEPQFDEPELDKPDLDENDLFNEADEARAQPGVNNARPPTAPNPRRNRPPVTGGRKDGPTNMEQFEKDRRQAAETCQTELDRVRADLLADIDLGISTSGVEGWDYPFECSIDDGSPYPGRHWPEVTYMWKAAANCHKPLYFEQHHLERYGHSWGPCVQPLVSGAHFFTRLPVLPYCMGITPPNECLYPLGYYRPGNCAPYMVDPIPFSWRAALFQAGATVGTAAFLP